MHHKEKKPPWQAICESYASSSGHLKQRWRHLYSKMPAVFLDAFTMTHPSIHRFWPYLAATVAAIVLDQISKIAILRQLPHQSRTPIIDGFFDLTHVYNPGAAFSFLANAGGWQKYLFTVFALVVSAYLLRQIYLRQLDKIGACAAVLIAGGALGNALDRLLYGHVIDFILLYWQQYYYPAFNLADSFICVGAVLYVIDGIRQEKRNKQQNPNTPSNQESP